MRSLLARLAVLGAFAVSVSACGGGSATSLPVAGPPNNNGGTVSIYQSGANGTALVRFVQGSPDVGSVLFCIDQSSAYSAPSVAYKGTALFAVPGTLSHVISVYAASAGPACASAPGKINGTAPIATTMITTTLSTRTLVALGGRAGSTLGLYVWTAPTFPVAPSAPQAIGYNDAPTFGAVGFGYQATAGAAVTTIAGLASVNPPAKPATTTSATPTAAVTGALPAIPATFVDGKPATPIVPLGTYTVPAALASPSTSAPGTPVIGQVYVPDLIAVDSAAAAKLDIVVIAEPTTGYGF
ncbi:MAG TPA: hypothetical protein VMA36_21325 [Candidatus Limnocylindria bacterium]|jgi:hypothetical protein|nr:hypothetical protein [Candidatus Limnocylindria bacterium]